MLLPMKNEIEKHLLDRLMDVKMSVEFETPAQLRENYDKTFREYEKDLQKLYIAERDPKNRAKFKKLIMDFLAYKLQAKAKMLTDQPAEIISKQFNTTVTYPLKKAEERLDEKSEPVISLLRTHIGQMRTYSSILMKIMNTAAQSTKTHVPAPSIWTQFGLH